MDRTTEPIIAVIGHPIAGNPTQFALERGFQAAQIDCRVLSIDLAPSEVETALAGMLAMSFRAVWVTPSCRSSMDLTEGKAADGEPADELAGDEVAGSDAAGGEVAGAQRQFSRSGAAGNLLDLLIHDAAEQRPATWSDHSMKQHVWTSIVHDILVEQDRSCDQLWWVDSDTKQSAESHSQQKQAVLQRIQSHGGERWRQLSVEQIDIVSDLSQVCLHDAHEKSFNVIVVAHCNTPPRADWQAPPNGLVIDLNENWDPAYLVAWDRIKQSSLDDFSHECVRGADVHAACLAKLTELLFGTRVSAEIFHEAIDEYLAV